MLKSTRSIALSTAAAGAAFAFMGALEATHDFPAETHHTIDSTAEYLVTGGLPIALVLLAPMYRLLGQLAGRARAGLAAAAAMLVLAALSASSVVNGEDLAIFDVVAPLCLLTWLVSSVLLTIGLRRTNAVPKAVAFALPGLLIITFPLATVGGPLVTGAFWIAIAARMVREPALQPAVA